MVSSTRLSLPLIAVSLYVHVFALLINVIGVTHGLRLRVKAQECGF